MTTPQRNPFDASDDNGASVQCVVCARVIPQGRWFQRVTLHGKTVALCSPYCAAEFEVNPERHLKRMEQR